MLPVQVADNGINIKGSTHYLSDKVNPLKLHVLNFFMLILVITSHLFILIDYSSLTGSLCQYVDQCKQNKTICGNGTCEAQLDGTAWCNCGWGYSGSFCENDINECNASPRPCDDVRQTCVNTPGSYKCLCKPGYTG